MRSGLRIVSAYGEQRVVGPAVTKRAFGVPPGGPFDRLSAALANALVGLSDDSPVLEIALGPVIFEAASEVNVAVVGGPDGLFHLGVGERIEVRPVGARAYVATVNGSPSPPPGERRQRTSTPRPRVAPFGGPSFLSQTKGRGALLLANPPRVGDEPLRVVRGPQTGLLDFETFLEGVYTVGLASNRVGVRLEGNALPHGLSLPSEPAIPGVVQVPPGGEPIILGPDGPTIGGYPKVAVVIDADLDRVGRQRPGDAVRFAEVSRKEARVLARDARMVQQRRCAELRTLGL